MQWFLYLCVFLIQKHRGVTCLKTDDNNMKKIKSLSTEANNLREKFQNLVVNPFIKANGSLRGYKGQIYILLPRFDGRRKLFRGFSKESYRELKNYLFTTQSQRCFVNCDVFENSLTHVRAFENQSFLICYNRVWHNGTTCYTGDHWAAQAAALYDGIKKYDFTYYEHDYNFPSYLYTDLKNANPLLKSIYSKILERKMAKYKTIHNHE